MTFWLPLILGAVGLLVGSGGLVTVMAQRRKLSAEGTKVITDAALSLLAPLEARVKNLEARVLQLEAENRALTVWGLANEELVRIHGGQPVAYRPPPAPPLDP